MRLFLRRASASGHSAGLSHHFYELLECRTMMAANNAPTFVLDGDGIVTTAVSQYDDYGECVAVQPDGRVLVGGTREGTNYAFALTRYLSDGSIDSSFGGGDGIVITDFGPGDDLAKSISIQPNGKILVGGSSHNGLNADFALVRYESNGALDTSFGGGDGKVTTPIGAGDDVGFSVALQIDSKIVVAGASYSNAGSDFAVARYLPDGTLDTNFGGGDGKVVTSIGNGIDECLSISLQSDGRLLLVGHAFNGANYDIAAVRYLANGTLDIDFGEGNGVAVTDIGGKNNFGLSAKIQSNGKFLVGGHSFNAVNDDFLLARFNSDGTLDLSFGVNGIATTDISNDEGRSIALQPDGKIITAGYSYNGFNYDFTVLRHLSNGSLDSGFGTQGIVKEAIGSGNDLATSVAVQADGRILIAGQSQAEGGRDFTLLRLLPNGQKDVDFGGTNTLGGLVEFHEDGDPVVLDNDVQIFDAELTSSDSFSGALLTLTRSILNHPEDVFTNTGTLSPLVTGGDIEVAGTKIGVVLQNTDGKLVLEFNQDATNALVNSTMRQLSYQNVSNSPPSTVEVEWTFSDGNRGEQGSGGELAAKGRVSVSVVQFNDIPTLDSIEDLLVDEDTLNFVQSLYGISSGGEDQPLRVISRSSNPAVIPEPLVNYESPNHTGSITLKPIANQFGTSTITITVEDGGLDQDLATISDNASFSRSFLVTVNSVNDNPTISNLGGDVNYRENVVIARLCNAVRITDIDTPVFAIGTLRVAIELGGEAADRLWLMNSQYLTVNGNELLFNGLVVGSFSGGTSGQPLLVTFNNRATINRVQHVLRCVCFAHDSDNPQATQRTVSIQLSDGAGGQVSATKPVNVIPVNDRPMLTGIPVASTYMLNSPVIRIAPAAVLTDPDSQDFAGGSLSLRFTSGNDLSNRLLLGGGFTTDANNNVLRNGVIIGTRNTGGGIGTTELQLTFNSNATRDVVQQLLRGLSFRTINGTSKSIRTIEFSLTDGDGGSSIATTRIDVT